MDIKIGSKFFGLIYFMQNFIFCDSIFMEKRDDKQVYRKIYFSTFLSTNC